MANDGSSTMAKVVYGTAITMLLSGMLGLWGYTAAVAAEGHRTSYDLAGTMEAVKRIDSSDSFKQKLIEDELKTIKTALSEQTKKLQAIELMITKLSVDVDALKRGK